MSADREAFTEQVERQFALGRRNIIRDGFCMETLNAFAPTGAIAATFTSAQADMDRDRLADLVPAGTRVIARPLTEAGTLLAAGLALSSATAAVYVGVVDIDDEPHLVAVGAWPEAVHAMSFAVPLMFVEDDRAVETSTGAMTTVTGELLTIENWLMSLIPDLPVTTSRHTGAILAS